MKACTGQLQSIFFESKCKIGFFSFVRRELQAIAEDPDNPPPAGGAAAAGAAGGGKPGAAAAAAAPGGGRPPLTAAQQKRATMVKKAIRYFEDKSNRSVSEDNLFTRRG